MGYSLEQFSAECRRILKQDPGVEGRKQVCALVRDVLKDDEFVAANLGDDVPARKVLYEDPELGFCILGHVNHGANESKPHDHGPSWAIYGQARGMTIMTDYEPVARPGEGKPGKARPIKDYTLTPGMAYLYNEGDLAFAAARGHDTPDPDRRQEHGKDSALSLRARRLAALSNRFEITGGGRPTVGAAWTSAATCQV